MLFSCNQRYTNIHDCTNKTAVLTASIIDRLYHPFILNCEAPNLEEKHTCNLTNNCTQIMIWYKTCDTTIGPLHDPVTWYGINYTGTQITQWDFQNKGKSGWTGASSFVLEVPMRNLRASVIYSIPCDRIVQRAYLIEWLQIVVWLTLCVTEYWFVFVMRPLSDLIVVGTICGVNWKITISDISAEDR